ncbi:MAG TPA: hypothetical protein VGP33_04850 [Chloroflexota bacterium]|nr:hypothetical protein [Chloroflexota bacterium]
MAFVARDAAATVALETDDVETVEALLAGVAAAVAAVIGVAAAVGARDDAVVVTDAVTVDAAPQAARASVEPTAKLARAIARRQVRRVHLAIATSQLDNRPARHCAN